MPFDRSRYPADWPAFSRRIRARSGGRCECRGDCGVDHSAETLQWNIGFQGSARCAATNGEPHPITGSRVVLTVAHRWRGPCAPCHAVGRKCAEPDHVGAYCQACHLRYDAPQHQANARRTRRARKAAGDLFDPPDPAV